MKAALVVVWLGTTASLGAHQPDLDGWAASRGRLLEEPASEPALPTARHDDALAERLEALLADARAETYSTDTAAAEAALNEAEGLLVKTPELPESAWLMAEVYRERAAIVAGRDPTLASALERRARSLSGPRAASFAASALGGPGEKRAGARSPVRGVPSPAAPPELTPPKAVSLEGPLLTDEVAVDGVEVGAPRTIPDGAHHVRVLRGGRLAWAAWVDASGDGVRAGVRAAAACSTMDLAQPSGDTDGGRQVLCEDYALVRPLGPERIEVARCHHSSCGTWLPWSREWGATFEDPVTPARRAPSSHAAIFWTAAGVAAAVIGGIVLAEEGAFDRRGPTRETFTFVLPK